MKTKVKSINRKNQKNIWSKEICEIVPTLAYAKILLIIVFLILATFGIVEVVNRNFNDNKKAIIENSRIEQGKKVVIDLVNSIPLPSISPSIIRTHSITGMTHTLEFDTAKYLNPTTETETYSLQFRKQTPGLEYAITGERFTHIYLLDKTYILSLIITKEGFPVSFEKEPILKSFKTSNFGEILKIKSEIDLREGLKSYFKSEEFISQYMYTKNLEKNCGLRKYCGLMELAFPSAYNENASSNISIICYATSEDESNNCDSIISSMKITQIK